MDGLNNPVRRKTVNGKNPKTCRYFIFWPTESCSIDRSVAMSQTSRSNMGASAADAPRTAARSIKGKKYAVAISTRLT
jgi:hypothetical protein